MHAESWKLDGGAVRVFLIALGVALFLASGAAAQTPQALMQRYKCDLCHADLLPRAGPAYVDVAARYKGDPKAVAKIAAMIRKGIKGNSPWHMPPHPEVSDADARLMARYIVQVQP
jgi:cytochrome c